MTRAVASLGMYDHPEQQWANDAIWARIAEILDDRGIAAPPALDRNRSVEELWRDPALLFGQACGYPLVSQSDLALRVLALPHYDVPHCAPGEHVSFVVTRKNDQAKALTDYRGRTAAINARHSNTGHNLFRSAVAPLATAGRFFDSVVETGSHRASISAVISGDADVATIDAVTYAGVARFEPDVSTSLRILATTRSSPTPPFVTARSTNVETLAALRLALDNIMADPSLAKARNALFLTGATVASIAPYATLRTLEIDAIGAGYPTLN